MIDTARQSPIRPLLLPVTSGDPRSLAGSNNFRYIDIASVDRDEKVISDVATINVDEAPSRARQLVRTGDVLVSTVRPNLNAVAVVPQELDGAIASTGFCVLRANPKLASSRYLFHWVRTREFVNEMIRLATGASYPAVSDRIILDSKIPAPDAEEQKRIAAILEKADAIRRKRRDAISAASKLPVSIFNRCFTFSTDDQAKFRPLNAVAQVVSGVTKGRRFNGATTRSVPYLRVANVQDGYLDLAEIKTIEALPDEISALALKPGDVVMTEGGDYDKLGRGALWESAIPECIHQNHVFRVRLDQNEVLPEFFTTYLRTSAAKAYFLRCAKKTTNLASINSTQLKGLPVPSVPIDDQKYFVALLKKQGSLMERFNSQAEYADELFNSLVNRAFRGDL